MRTRFDKIRPAEFFIVATVLVVALLSESGVQSGQTPSPQSGRAVLQQILDRSTRYRPIAHSSAPPTVEKVYPDAHDKSHQVASSEALDFGYLGRLLVIVNGSLYGSIKEALDIYRTDVEQEGYTVEIYLWSGGNNRDFRTFLQQQADGLAGIVLIGELPPPWIQWDLELNDFWCDSERLSWVTCDLPYMDLDGIWIDNDDDGAWDSCDPYSDLEPEIFLGRLYAGNLSWTDEADALNDYLQRNHQFRTGMTNRPPRALIFATSDSAECSFMGEVTDRLTALGYSGIACTSDPADQANSKAAYLDSIAGGNYELVNIRSHGGADRHWFKQTSEFVYGTEIQAAGCEALFLHNISCGGAAWTVPDCVTSAYVFGQASGLAVWGTTVIGGFNATNDFYPELASGANLGEALKVAYDSILARGYSPQSLAHRSCHEICYDSLTQTYGDTCFYMIPTQLATLIGDPTLRPRKRSWIIRPDGSGDAPTIQAGIDSAASFERVILEAGVFVGDGNYDIDFHGKPVTVSARAESTDVVIDCRGNGRAFNFHSGEPSVTRVVGVKIINAASAGDGGAILCEQGASPTLVNCLITRSSAMGRGAAIAALDSSAAVIQGCTIAGNESDSGAGIFISTSSGCKLQRCLIVFNQGIGIVYLGDNANAIECSDVYGNSESDYLTGLDFSSSNNNFSIDPQFCDTAALHFALLYTTPCEPNVTPCGDWVGATRIGCFSVCGDCDTSGFVSISDAVMLIAFIFGGGPAPQPLLVGDVDCTGIVNISDVVHLIEYIFGGGPIPCAGCP